MNERGRENRVIQRRGRKRGGRSLFKGRPRETDGEKDSNVRLPFEMKMLMSVSLAMILRENDVQVVLVLHSVC